LDHPLLLADEPTFRLDEQTNRDLDQFRELTEITP